MALLLYRRRLGIALRDDDAAQVRTVLAWYIGPNLMTLVFAKVDCAIGVARIQENTPSGSHAS